MKYTLSIYKWQEYIYHRGSSWIFQSILGSGIILGRKKNDKARQPVFLTPLNPWGNVPEEEKPHFDCTVLQKVPHETRWKRNQDAVYWVRLSTAQDQRLQLWQTKSFAIMAYATIPRDCIDRVTAENRGSSNFREACNTKSQRPKVKVEEELAKPATAARTAAAAAHFQHRRNKTLETKRPGKTKQNCKTTRETSQKRIKHLETGCNPFLKLTWILISVAKKSAQNAFLNDEANNQFVFAKIWRRRRWCLAKNPAKLFSKWVVWSSLNRRHH